MDRHLHPAVVADATINADGMLEVVGPLPTNCAVAVVPRRYRSRPDWWGLEVTLTGPEGAVAPQGQTYRITCPLDGLAGREGIAVYGADGAMRVSFQRGEGTGVVDAEPRRVDRFAD